MKSSRRVACHSNEHHLISIDLTLEQTINADAVCQHSGMILLTNSIYVWQHWAQSHSICTSILSKCFEQLGMTSTEDISEEFKPLQVKQNCHHLIFLSINNTMNPIASTIEKEHLFNIANGKAALDETVDFLNNVWTIGFSVRDCFIKDWKDDPNAYQNTIKQQKIKNFASEAGCYKVFYHALQAKVDMEQILGYVLTLVPLSMSHMDGTMQKTTKLKFLQELEKRVASNPSKNVDVTIIDGMFFFHLLHQPPSTFAGVTDHLLRQVCKQRGTETHLAFDKTIPSSIRDAERNKRSNQRGMAYQITRCEQKRPSNWLQVLRGDHFKKALVTFSVDYLENDNSARILGSKKLIVNNGDTCYSFISQEVRMEKSMLWEARRGRYKNDIPRRTAAKWGKCCSENCRHQCGCDCPGMLSSTTR